VYLGHVASHVINSMCSTVHMPEIFIVKDLPMVTVFRKPGDAIASVIHKQLERSGENPVFYSPAVVKAAYVESETYKKYLNGAAENHSHIYIAKFDEITKNTLEHLIRISEVFNLPTVENYQERFASILLDGDVWSGRYDGHLPREKSQTRLQIENVVSSLDFINELNKEHDSFIKDYAL